MSGVLKKIFGGGDDRNEDDEIIADVDDDELDEDEGPDDEEEPDEENEEDESSEDDGQLALDVFQNGNNIIVKSTIAGVKPEDLDITVANDKLTIRGERRQEEEVEEHDYFYRECYWGGFSRTISLPAKVDVDEVEADIKDGILTVVLPTVSGTRSKKVRVKGE